MQKIKKIKSFYSEYADRRSERRERSGRDLKFPDGIFIYIERQDAPAYTSERVSAQCNKHRQQPSWGKNNTQGNKNHVTSCKTSAGPIVLSFCLVVYVLLSDNILSFALVVVSSWVSPSLRVRLFPRDPLRNTLHKVKFSISNDKWSCWARTWKGFSWKEARFSLPLPPATHTLNLIHSKKEKKMIREKKKLTRLLFVCIES